MTTGTCLTAQLTTFLHVRDKPFPDTNVTGRSNYVLGHDPGPFGFAHFSHQESNKTHIIVTDKS